MVRSAWLFLLVAVVSSRPSPGQPSLTDIPAPSGPFAIGRVIYDWVDTARSETLSGVPNAPRELVVDVWYPAAAARADARTAPYLPGATQIDKSSAAQAEKNNWGGLWKPIVSGDVHTHVYENAPPAPGDARFPLLIFSHAFAGEPYAYTHQIQELVSHGYVVATVHHTYEVTVARFADGRMIPFSQENAQAIEAPTLDEALKRAEPRIDVWAGDIRFTLDQVTRLNMATERKAPFAGRVDLGRVGVLGHSFGGVAVARACELDQRIKACLNQDGMVGGPIVRFAGGGLPAQPYMFLRSPMPAPPSDDRLRGMGTTRKELEQDKTETEAALAREFHDCCGGAYQVWIEIPGFRHGSFSDQPLLRAGNPAERAKALSSLRLVESYTIAFFEKFLNGAHDTLLDRQPAKGSPVVVKRYSR
jgi:Platelet-activating factor acetylhydrolase, isoform II